MSEKVRIVIEGKTLEVPAGKNILQVCLDEGHIVPHFCYHEALGAVGACRLCAAMVAPAVDKPARLEMTCMTRASEGMIVSVNDTYASQFRKGLIEELMLNHPHDCPVCDEGGECMLQDMTVMGQHQHRRTREPKRTWDNQDLGPLIHHEMNRCITCYRCVRYYSEYALGDDFGVFGSRGRVYFGRVEDGTLQSEFAGNLCDVCPTGVFTDKRHRDHHARPWDLQTAKSVCVNCSVGCNLLPGFRHSTLRRVKPLENPAVNKYFICDRGRFGGEYVNSPERLLEARVAGAAVPLETAVEVAADKLRSIRAAHGEGSIAAVAGQHVTLEGGGALSILLSALDGTPPVYFRTNHEREAVRRAASITAGGEVEISSLPEIEEHDFVLNLGGDLTGEAPMIDLAVRQVIRSGHAYYSVAPRAGKLDSFARASELVAPSGESTVAREIADGLIMGEGKTGEPSPHQEFVTAVVTALNEAKNPLILCSVLHGDAALVEAAYGLAKRASKYNRKCRLAYYFAGPNTVGAGLLRADSEPDSLYQAIADGSIKALIVTERNLVHDFAREEDLNSLLARLELLVVIDSIGHPLAARADVLLPCVSHYQAFGTFVNFEGRAQRFGGLHIPSPVTQTSGEVLLSLVGLIGAGERIAATDYHHVYDIEPSQSAELDALRPGTAGLRLRGETKAAGPKFVYRPPKPVRLRGAIASTNGTKPSLTRWDIISAFGSEEISALSAPIQELAPLPVLELNPADAAARSVADGDTVDLTAELGVRGTVVLNPRIAPGTLGVPVLYTQPVPVEATA